jgi:uncharacterized protein YjdB
MVAVVLLLTVSISANAQTSDKTDAAKSGASLSDDSKMNDNVLKLEPAKFVLEVGHVQKVVIKDHSTKEKVEWSSSNKEIASVDGDGIVTAVSVGKTTIIATSGKAEGKCEVAVEKTEVPMLKLEPEKLVLKTGEVQNIAVKDYDGETLKWSSDNEKVAVVNEKGAVKAVSAGKAIITATAGKREGKCNVVVEEPASKEKR